MPAYQDKKTKKWFFQVNKTIDGEYKQFRRSGFDRKGDALEAEREFLNSFNEFPDGLSKVSFKDLCYRFINKQKTKIKQTTAYKNKKRIEKHIINLIPDIKLNKIRNKDIIDWKNNLIKKDYSQSFTNTVIKDLKDIITFGTQLYNLPSKLILELDGIRKSSSTKKEIVFFTKDEFDKFINVINNPIHSLLFKVLFFTGIRIGELQALTWEDYKDNSLNINKTLSNKSGTGTYELLSPKTQSSIRQVLIDPKLKNELDLYKESILKLKDFKKDMFIFGTYYPFSHSSISRWKNQYCNLAKVKQIRLHDFRHSHASYLINLGADILLVSKRLGHKDISETLNTYSHLYPNKQEELLKFF